jgi:hypothetical protein
MPLFLQDRGLCVVCVKERAPPMRSKDFRRAGSEFSEGEGNGESERRARCELRTVLAAGVTRRGNRGPNVNRGCGGGGTGTVHDTVVGWFPLVY